MNGQPSGREWRDIPRCRLDEDDLKSVQSPDWDWDAIPVIFVRQSAGEILLVDLGEISPNDWALGTWFPVEHLRQGRWPRGRRRDG